MTQKHFDFMMGLFLVLMLGLIFRSPSSSNRSPVSVQDSDTRFVSTDIPM